MLDLLCTGNGACSGDVSWTQNMDESTLRRLNATAGEGEGEESTCVLVVVPGAVAVKGVDEQVETGAAVEEVSEKGDDGIELHRG